MLLGNVQNGARSGEPLPPAEELLPPPPPPVIADVSPSPQGGIKSFYKYISENLKYPS